MKAIIVDDERLARLELVNLLKEHKNITVIGECSNAEEAKIEIEKLRPDLIFLDIQMPEKTGFDLLEELDYIPEVIFVTAYDEYAIKAFEINAFDYILKPVDPERLTSSITKIKQEFEELKKAETEINFGTGKLNYSNQIFIKDGDKCWFTRLEDVRYFESDGNYVKVYFKDEKPMVLRSLNKVEERLDQKLFFRTSRKHIVNIKWIEKVDTWFSGGLKLKLKTGEEIEISRRQAQKFREMMSL